MIPGVCPLLRDLQDDAHREKKKHLVRLYKTTSKANHYLGEWLIQKAHFTSSGTYDVVLWRNTEQTKDVHKLVVYRSSSEREHHNILQKVLEPLGFDVYHEPEVASCPTKRPIVARGVLADWVGAKYTVHFVAINFATGRRYCFESKASVDGFDKEALKKTRFLRRVGGISSSRSVAKKQKYTPLAVATPTRPG